MFGHEFNADAGVMERLGRRMGNTNSPAFSPPTLSQVPGWVGGGRRSGEGGGGNNADAGVMERLRDGEWIALAPQPSHHHHHHPNRPATPPFLCQLTTQLPGRTDRRARAGESREVTWRGGSSTPDAYLHAAKDVSQRPDNTTQRDRAFPPWALSLC